MKDPKLDRNLKEEVWDQSKEWVDAIGGVIEEAAKQLGVAAEHIYTVYTKQMFVEGIVYSAGILLMYAFIITSTILAYRFCVRHYHREEDKKARDYDGSTRLIPLLLGGVILVITILFSAGPLVESVMKIFNPEYYTLKYLLDTAKEMVK